ncbi:MAG: ribonuclease P protein component [Deltaproteobacteria bacterium]|nr:ribonuclease P protein component [Deltaproteobacteria bacterium]
MSRFPHHSRITEKRDFDRLKKGALSKGNPCFVLRWISVEKQRLGVIVSKKVAKAHKRNLIKRIVREHFRLHPEEFPLGDVLVVARPKAALIDREKIWFYLKNVLQTSRSIKK